MSKPLTTIQSREILTGIAFDGHAGARKGFIADVAIRDRHKINVGAHLTGSFLVGDTGAAFSHGMNGRRGGRALGTPRPKVSHEYTSTVDWETKLLGFEDDIAYQRLPDYFREGATWSSSENEAKARRMAQSREMRAARAIQLAITRQKEFEFATPLIGSDMNGGALPDGVGPSLPLWNLSAPPVAVAGGGGNTADEAFPLIEFLNDILNFVEDESGADQFDIILGKSAAREFQKNLQLKGVRLVGSTADGLQAIDNGDVILTLDSIPSHFQRLGMISRLLIAGAKADYGTKSARDIKDIWPNAITVLGYTDDPELQSDGSMIQTEATGIVEITGQRNDFFGYVNDTRTRAGWAADIMYEAKVVNPKFGLTVMLKK